MGGLAAQNVGIGTHVPTVINWQRTKIEFNPYKRWVDLWRKD
jgi:hypothetical protein